MDEHQPLWLGIADKNGELEAHQVSFHAKPKPQYVDVLRRGKVYRVHVLMLFLDAGLRRPASQFAWDGGFDDAAMRGQHLQKAKDILEGWQP